MFVYTITTKVSDAIAEQWLQWQLNEHIPGIMQTGLFTDYKLFRLLDQDDTEGPTYVIQYFTDERKNYDLYTNDYAPALRKKAFQKWGDKFISFQTLLKVMH